MTIHNPMQGPSAPLHTAMGKEVSLLLLLLLLATPSMAQTADPIAPVMEQIEQNNLRLQAAREAEKAEVLEARAGNNLSNPEVNYAHLYNSERASQQQSELTVVQAFDFPTAYAARSKQARLQAEAARCGYGVERRNILLEAKLLCLDLIGLNREADLLNLLQAHADSLTRLCEKRLQAGDATALEVNRAKLDLMTLRTELADNTAAHRAALQRLVAMNGNLPVNHLPTTAYPTLAPLPDYDALRDQLIPLNKELQQAEATLQATQKEVNVNKQGWLPRLQVGYRRNTAPTEQFNGFVVGGSIPLFENKSKVKAARARTLSAQLAKDDLTITTEATLQARHNEARQMQEAMRAYDLPLMQHSFTLLAQALNAGQLTWHEYFVELEALVRRAQSYLQIENRYHKLMAEIYADRV